jgi:hypothetical protein
MADALAADDIQKNHNDPNQEYHVHETSPKPELEPMTMPTVFRISILGIKNQTTYQYQIVG